MSTVIFNEGDIPFELLTPYMFTESYDILTCFSTQVISSRLNHASTYT